MVIPPDLRQLIEAQDGLVTRQQALEHGVSDDAMRHALRPGGSWQRILRGTFATFTGPLQPRHTVRAALLIAGPAAMVSGAFACHAYGMRYLPDDAPLIVLVPNRVRRTQVPGVVFRRTRSMPRPRSVAGIPCAPPERAAIDAVADDSSLRTVRATLCEVVQRGLCRPNHLTAAAATVQSDNSLIRRTLREVEAGCKSSPECEIRDLIRTSTVLPEPVWNEPLPDATAAPLVPDGQWKQARLVLEIDSVEWHRFGEKPEATERRRARYAALGHRVMPISPRRIRDSPHAVLIELEDAYRIGVSQSSGGESN